MNIVLAIPLSVRLCCLFVLGAAAGGWINLAAYRLAWNRRSISPWSPSPPGAAPRRWKDRLPIAGWWSLARESEQHGRGFWIRPMLVEAATGALFAALYWWTITQSAPWLIPNGAAPAPAFLAADMELVRHARLAAQLLLVSLMLAASLIDIDEKTIPDAITVTGTILGLTIAASYPWTLLPAGEWLIAGQPQVEFLTLASPNPWPPGLNGLPRWSGAALAWGCWTLWCGGLLPRRWNTRRGWGVACRVFLHRLRTDRITYQVLPMWAAGAVAIGLAAWGLGEARWAALVTALVGMIAAGGIIWAVRVVGSQALSREAMGFGDVTLMSMIGAFLGWQPAMVIFFVAPFLGLLVGLAQWMFHGEHEVPYGPFLCLATLIVMVDWNSIWHETGGIFLLGWLMPAVLGACVILMGLMLSVWRLILGRLQSRR